MPLYFGSYDGGNKEEVKKMVQCARENVAREKVNVFKEFEVQTVPW
jgi:hypothetical protein